MTNNQKNRSTILRLYEAVNGPIATQGVKKYSESTQTLYKNKNLNSGSTIKEKEVVVSTEVYQQILRGDHLYVTLNRKDIMIGDELKIYEDSPIKRFVYRTVLGIETSIDNPGLKPEYIIASFGR